MNDIDIWDTWDCPYFNSYDDGEDYPPNFHCEKSGVWFDEIDTCFKCRGQWSKEQLIECLK